MLVWTLVSIMSEFESSVEDLKFSRSGPTSTTSGPGTIEKKLNIETIENCGWAAAWKAKDGWTKRYNLMTVCLSVEWWCVVRGCKSLEGEKKKSCYASKHCNHMIKLKITLFLLLLHLIEMLICFNVSQSRPKTSGCYVLWNSSESGWSESRACHRQIDCYWKNSTNT